VEGGHPFFSAETAFIYFQEQAPPSASNAGMETRYTPKQRIRRRQPPPNGASPEVPVIEGSCE
jgi:hypothetical protein